MTSKALEMRLQAAERELRDLQDKTGALEDLLGSIRICHAKEERERAAGKEPVAAPTGPARIPVTPPPLPEAPVVHEEGPPAPDPAPSPAGPEDAPVATGPLQELVTAAKEAAEPEPRDGFELQLGRVWFVRIGIGLVLTGLVFLSSYAYQNFIINWDAGSRVTLMYIAAAILAGFGVFLERSRESLRNYARVVTAGGFAAIYYTTYAAHHVAALKVIGEPVTAAVLMTLCALVFFAYAAWRKSSTLTLAALLLGFYSIAINPMGSLGCFSGLLLSAIGMYFFLRRDWMNVGFTALAGAYGSFAYWQGLINGTPDDPARWFLLGYWLLFTGATLAPGVRRIPASALAIFAGLNNVLAFLLFSFDLGSFTWHPALGTHALVFGGVLVVLAAVLPRVGDHPRSLLQVFLAQGLALVTWGLSIELSGYQLFLSLAIEAALLAVASQRSGWILFRIAAVAVAVLSAATAVYAKLVTALPVPAAAWLGAGAILAVGAYFMRRRPGNDEDALPLHPEAMLFSAFALLVPSIGLLTDLSVDAAGRWMAAAGLVLGALAFLPGRRWPLPELGWLAQPYALAGGIFALLGDNTLAGFLVPTVVLGALVHLNNWQARPGGNKELATVSRFFEFAFALLFTAGLGRSLAEATTTTAALLAVLVGLPLAFHLYGTLTRCRGMALVPQLLYLPAALLAATILVDHPEFGSAGSWAVLLGTVVTAAHGVVLTLWGRPAEGDLLRKILLPMAALSWFGWCLAFVDHPQLPIAFTGLALIFLPAKWQVPLHVPVFLLFLVSSLGLASLDLREPYWACYLALPAGFAAHLWLTRETTATAGWHRNFHEALAPLVAAALVILVSRHTLDLFDGKGLAVVWALLGVFFFATGLGVRRRLYRWASLLMLAATLAHVLTIDVWKLDTVLRIASFLTLGLVLLALGFVYNRWADQIKRLL